MNLKRVILYGILRKRFGREFRLDVDSPAEAIRALSEMVPGFRQAIYDMRDTGLRVLVGDEARGEETVYAPMSGREVIKLVPVVAGAKSPLGQILIGAALIAVSFVPGLNVGAWAWVGQAAMSMGISMTLGGVAQLLATPPAYNASAGDKGPGDTPTYSFNGPHLTVGQGNPVPVLLGGPLRIGGALISMGISSETWPVNGLGGMGDEANPGTAVGNGDTIPWVWAKAPL